MEPARYRGRFAPSPTGALHFGSLVAAVASHADARHHGGEWLVRIEDVDQTRARRDAETEILTTLAAFGMTGDRPPVRQCERSSIYRDALARLRDAGWAYRCGCGRRRVADDAERTGPEGPIYAGTCARRPPPDGVETAWRVRVDDSAIAFEDRVVGSVRQRLDEEIGDFVIHRIDGFTAYQLAVVVDDHDQGVTDVVRGADLLWSTPRQIWLQRLLGFPQPSYAHLPLVYGSDGRKLSKRDQAHPVDRIRPLEGLFAAWRHLGQRRPPADIRCVDGFWSWAATSWRIEAVPHDDGRPHVPTDAL